MMQGLMIEILPFNIISFQELCDGIAGMNDNLKTSSSSKHAYRVSHLSLP